MQCEDLFHFLDIIEQEEFHVLTSFMKVIHNVQFVLEDHCIATFKDHFTRKAWAFVCQRKTQDNIINCLTNITTAQILQTDNGKEFGNKVKEFCDERNILLLHGKPYHPRTQGSVES